MTVAPGDLQGLRHPRPLRRADRRRRRRADRARVRARASPASRASRPASCGSASGRDMRLTAPELAARYREGIVAEGAHVLDAGQVGTEMLYYLVGSRELDGGLMCTASHNPKAYTGAKLVKRGRDRAVGRRAASRTSATWIEDGGLGRPRRAAARRGGRHLRGVPGGGAHVHRPGERQAAEGRRRRRQRDGRARWSARCSSASGSTWSRPTGRPTATSPTTSPTRCCPRTAQFIIDKVRDEGADLGIAWDGDADRCFFIDDTRRVRRRRLPDRAARRVTCWPSSRRARRSSTTCAPRGRSPTPSSAPAARRSSTASATPSSRRGCARRARSSAARSPATTTSATSTAPTRARSRRC